MNPQVRLIEIPTDIVRTIYTACRTCYSSETPSEIFDNSKTKEQMLKLIRNVMKSGHLSTVEHVQLTFTISNVSRCCIQQLTRHRFLMFSQQSQRYVSGAPSIVTPNAIMSSDEARKIYTETMATITTAYNNLIRLGINAEDARYLLPNGATTNLVVSTNLRELMHVANLRLCTRAQQEIRQLVQAMCNEVVSHEFWLKEFLVPKCEVMGKCTERECCGRIKNV